MLPTVWTHRPPPFERTAASLLALAALGLVASTGCGPERSDVWEASYDVSEPQKAGARFVAVNRTLEELNVLEPTGGDGSLDMRLRRAPTGPDPTRSRVGPSGDRYFLVNSGDQTLSVFDLSGDELTRDDVQLDAAYDRITPSPDGEFLLLSFSGAPSEGGRARSTNEVGLVDLRDGVPDDATFQTLDKRAQDVVFAEPFEIDGMGQQRLAAAMLPSKVALLDLNRLADNPDDDDAVRYASLTLSEADPTQRPTDVLFDTTPSGESQSFAVYVLTDRSSDVTRVAVTPNTSSDGRKFNLSINQLAAGSSPRAMELLQLPDVGERLMTLDGAAPRFHLIDVQSGESSAFELPFDDAPTDMFTYTVGQDGGDDGASGERRVLVWSRGDSTVAVVRPSQIAVSNDTPTAGRSVRAIDLGAPPESLRLDASGQRTRAIAFHRGGRLGFSILRLRADENSAVSIASSRPSDAVFTPGSAWGLYRQTDGLTRFNLDNGHPTNYSLPKPGSQLIVDRDAGLLMVDHGEETGEFTILDAEAPGPDNAVVEQGVFIRDILTRGVERSSE